MTETKICTANLIDEKYTQTAKYVVLYCTYPTVQLERGPQFNGLSVEAVFLAEKRNDSFCIHAFFLFYVGERKS